ncbi:transposon Ty3-I Gag-Pol polyprotein [Elysia marginata]|uniref:Transposon Ty3-I Gag-Pol polyprotein n=1 Tax=Elysia marginata TaxID=1093978 RepID=A0AAV4JFG1_9GAST|nr:transposon Ty3-I Gag-Pol polyprotein [Elysia marginata]
MEHTKIPPMNFDNANLAWKYKQREQNMKLLLEGPLADKTDKQKVAYFFFINIAQQSRYIFNTWELTDAEKTIGNLFEKFKLYCTPKKRLTTQRFRFNSRQQAESETIDQFVTALKLLAEGCEFGDLQPSVIRDRVICGTKECSIKERLLQEDDPMLEEALKIARSLEASKLDLSSMGTAVRVHAVWAPRKEKSQLKTNSRQPPHILKQHQHQKHSQAQTPRSYPQKYCPSCGNLPHHQSQCPARGQMSNYCKKPNHFKKMCRKLKFNQKKIHNIDLTTDSDNQYEEGATCSFEMIQLNSVRTTDDEAYVILNVNLPNFPDKKTTLKAKIDTGSQENALPMRLYEKMFPDGLDRLTKSRTKITAYGGSQVKNYGTCKIQCSYKNLTDMATFYVTDDTGTAIIGLPSLQAMKTV